MAMSKGNKNDKASYLRANGDIELTHVGFQARVFSISRSAKVCGSGRSQLNSSRTGQ